MKYEWIFGVFVLATITTARAHAGSEGVGGGDICEDRIKIVRDDIAAWINRGGSSGLTLPNWADLARYNSVILGAISQAKVSCTDEAVVIGNSEKTCKNFVDNGIPRVVCNLKRFMGMDQSPQYVLIHHEFAGISGIEINIGEDSDYRVSNQITGFLVDEVTKKLAVLPAPPQPSTGESFYARSKEMYAGARRPDLETKVSGWYPGRCYSLSEPNKPIAALWILEQFPVKDQGPLFPGAQPKKFWTQLLEDDRSSATIFDHAEDIESSVRLQLNLGSEFYPHFEVRVMSDSIATYAPLAQYQGPFWLVRESDNYYFSDDVTKGRFCYFSKVSHRPPAPDGAYENPRP